MRGLAGSGTPRHLLPVGCFVWVAAALGYQIPPRPSPKPRPTSCPALRRWAPLAPLLGPLVVRLGAAPAGRLQAVSGEELLPAPVAATTPPRGGCLGGGRGWFKAWLVTAKEARGSQSSGCLLRTGGQGTRVAPSLVFPLTGLGQNLSPL